MSRSGGVLRRSASLLVFAMSIFLFAGIANAEDSWGYDIAHELMSPYCPGRTLATCPSPQAAELIQWIVLQEAGGATQEEVVEMLIERFGDDILGAPKAEGVTLWAYIMPVLGFVVFGGVAVLVLRRIVGGDGRSAGLGRAAGEARTPTDSSRSAAPQSPSDDEDLARIVDGDLESRA